MEARDDPATAIVVVFDGAEAAVWPLPRIERPDLAIVDLLARLQLAVCRMGGSILVRNPSPELRDLLALVGLSGVLFLEPGREAEGGEQLGIEEVVQPGDPVA